LTYNYNNLLIEHKKSKDGQLFAGCSAPIWPKTPKPPFLFKLYNFDNEVEIASKSPQIVAKIKTVFLKLRKNRKNRLIM